MDILLLRHHQLLQTSLSSIFWWNIMWWIHVAICMNSIYGICIYVVYIQLSNSHAQKIVLNKNKSIYIYYLKFIIQNLSLIWFNEAVNFFSALCQSKFISVAIESQANPEKLPRFSGIWLVYDTVWCLTVGVFECKKQYFSQVDDRHGLFANGPNKIDYSIFKL